MAGATEDNQDVETVAYRVDDLIIDVGSQRVLRAGQEIPLPQLSFEFFLTLARAAPNVLTFEQLMDRVWSGLVVSPETVSQRVKLVRDALGDDSQAPRYIAGVRGRGYRMVAPVVPISANAPSEPAAVAQPVVQDKADAPSDEFQVRADALLAQSRRRRTIALVSAILSLIAVLVIVAQFRGWIDPVSKIAADSQSRAALPPKSIAVLPLLDISPKGGNEYLGDGLAEELTDRLTRIPGLRVAARTSAFAYKGRPDDVRKIAQSLGVRHVLEGSVRREGNRLRVTAQLIDAQSGFHIWSQSYDRTWQDLFDIQDDLARSIVEALQLVLSSDIVERLEQGAATNLEAFDLYLAGLSKLRQPSSPTQFDEAERIFQSALTIDPRFARAHAGLCETYTMAYNLSRDAALASKAEASCNQALALDGSLREVESALANLYRVSGRADEAVTIFQRSIARNPSDINAYIGLARSYEAQRREAEAEATYRRAIEVEPSYWRAHMVFGHYLFNHGRAAEAIRHYQRVTELAPADALAYGNLGAALLLDGRFEEAARALERSLSLESTHSALSYSNMGSGYYYLGRFEDAARMYRKAIEIARQDHRWWGNLADALYQIAERREESVSAYRRAISLAKRALEVNSKDAVAWAQLGFYQARLGELEQAQRSRTRALELGSDAVYVHYYAALGALESGDVATALSGVQRAIELGFPEKLIRAGPEFAKLRGDERFQRLFASAAGRQPAGRLTVENILHRENKDDD